MVIYCMSAAAQASTADLRYKNGSNIVVFHTECLLFLCRCDLVVVFLFLFF